MKPTPRPISIGSQIVRRRGERTLSRTKLRDPTFERESLRNFFFFHRNDFRCDELRQFPLSVVVNQMIFEVPTRFWHLTTERTFDQGSRCHTTVRLYSDKKLYLAPSTRSLSVSSDSQSDRSHVTDETAVRMASNDDPNGPDTPTSRFLHEKLATAVITLYSETHLLGNLTLQSTTPSTPLPSNHTVPAHFTSTTRPQIRTRHTHDEPTTPRCSSYHTHQKSKIPRCYSIHDHPAVTTIPLTCEF